MGTLAAAVEAAREVAVAQARDLARQGRLAEAEELLRSVLDDAEPGAATLDLLARIHAQQGRLDQADQCWARAESLAPGNKEIVEGRRRIAALRGRRTATPATGPGRGALLRGIGTVLVVLLAFALLIDIRREASRPVAAPTAPPTSAPPTSASAASDRTGPPGSRVSGSSGGATLDGLGLTADRLRAPGTRVRRSPGELSITFEYGLYDHGTTLSAKGRAALDELGRRLRPYADRISVAAIGHTDDRPLPAGAAFANNLELGTVRATIVCERLRAMARIRTAACSVSSLGGALPPFRGGAADQGRNRTVSLRISAGGEG